MLKRLRIQNLAVVEDVTLEFGSGLNVITGSTGAGKSLILGAVNLLLGHKPGAGAIRAGEDKAVVGATFELPRTPAEAGGEVTVEREIRRAGRGRARIDGTTVPVKQLRDRVARWIEPHGQNEQLRLRDAGTHAGYLDRYAGNEAHVAAYRDALVAWLRARGDLEAFEARLAAIGERQELLRHRLEEIERAKLRDGETEELDRSIGLMENAEKIFEAIRYVVDAADDDEDGVAQRLAVCARRVEGIAGLDGRLAGFADRLGEAGIVLADCLSDMRSYIDGFEFDPDRLEEKRQRRAYLFDLERRYGRPVAGIIDAANGWREELETVRSADEERDALTGRLRTRRETLRKAAGALGRRRERAAGVLDGEMTRELEGLMMPGARFRTRLAYETDAGGPLEAGGKTVAALADGAEVVRFMVRTNRGEAEGPVDDIASTGEVSRISLALKTVIRSARARSGSPDSTGGVLVFDELDAGVGGDLGGLIANKLLELAAEYQIICITHMPQIAAAGDRHLVVTKTASGSRTTARVRPAAGRGREREIARMLGGVRGSDNRRALAAELLGEKR